MFKGRIEAGYELAAKLMKYKNADGIVLAVPKGVVPMGYIVAKELGLPLEPALSKKIGHPMQKEYAIGAVSLWGSFVIPHDNVTQEYVNRETNRIHDYLKEMQARLMSDRKPTDLQNKTVIVIDDGIATGNTMLATIMTLQKQHPAKIVVAVPVAARLAYEKLSKQVDEMICLEVPEYFTGVGAFYEEFGDVSEEEVKQYLERAWAEHEASASAAHK